MKITVSTVKHCPTDEFHRAGLTFSKKPKSYSVTEEQKAAIERDPMLVVKERAAK